MGILKILNDITGEWENIPAIEGREGKSAYQYAVDGGYTGTEAEFAAKLAQEIPKIDPTLTYRGQSADSKTTGDALRSLSEEKISKPETAEIGQLLSVKSVDENGKPTEFKTVDPAGGGVIQETDPTVPAWAKQPEKPEYTAAEVHALPDTYTPPVDADLSEISTNPVQNKVVAAKLSEVESIAKGRATGYVFETETDMRTWIAANASALNLGDNLYIRATDVPDYWWDGTSAQPLETQKVDLTEYAKKSDVPSVDATLTQSGQAADAATVGQELSSLSGNKVSNCGWTAEKYLGTDSDGKVVEKDVPEGGGVTDAQVQTAVETWLDEHPEATTTVQDGSVTEIKLAPDVQAKLVKDLRYLLEYAYPAYTQATLNNDGTLNTSGIAYVTDKLPVNPGEKLWLNGGACKKAAFYDSSESFISIVTISTGLNPYTVPSDAVYAIFQVEYNDGRAKPLVVRMKDEPQNITFADLILSPLKTNLSIGITGDSNTYGYGLSDTSLSWANLLANALEQLTTMRYSYDSPWVESLGAFNYSAGYNYMNGSQMTIWTDARSISLGISMNYSSVWDWYVDDVLLDGQNSVSSVTLDGSLHKITVKFTGGQAVRPFLEISKTISVENVAEVGVGIVNLSVPTDKDWLLIMVGTNDRTSIPFAIKNNLWAYAGKGTYIVPFPNHKTEENYAVSQMQLYTAIRNIFEIHGYEIIDCSDVNAYAFYDNTLYQSDLIHFSAAGHRVICNMVSGKMGLPVMLMSE